MKKVACPIAPEGTKNRTVNSKMIFKTKSIQRTYFISSFLITTILLIILAAFFVYQAYQDFENEVESQRIEYVKFQKEIVKNEVNHAVGFIKFNKAKIAKRVKAGEKPYDVKKEIQNDIVQWIQGISFNKGGYIFLSTYDGIVLAHHRPEHIGRNLWDLTDPNGVKIHQTILKAGTEPGGGYMEYIGTKNPVTGKPGKKITFSKSIDDWKWLVGRGFYIDNIESVIAEKREQLTERVKSQTIHAVLIFLVVAVLATLIMNIFSRRIRKQFDLLNEYFQRSVTAYEKVDKNELPYEEFRTLSDSINKMVDEHKRAEEVLRLTNRALKTLSECNQAVVRAKEELQLLHEICRIIMDSGGYRLAWVGFAEQDEAKTVRSVAQAGYEEGYLETVNITFADTERGRGPTGTAIRTAKPIVVKNIFTDPNYTPWRSEASKRGYKSGIALPLISDGHAFGALNIYSEKADAFDTEEVKLLVELADDLAYGIMALRTREKRKQAEEKLEEYSKNLERMVEARTKKLRRALFDTEEARGKIDGILKSVADGLIVTDIYNRIILMNRAAEDLLGVRFSEVINRPIDVAIKDETLRQRFKASLEEREPGYQFEFELPGDNSKHPRIIRARTSEIKDKAGNQTGIITIIYDVTLEREVDEMKTEFLSTAAHQLRTPLTSIRGFSEILMTRDSIKKEQQKEFLSHINEQSVNLTNIINDLLDISRIESGIEFTLRKVSCDINEIIRKTVKYFQVSEPERQFDVILPKEPLEFMVDKDKIGQVLENLLSNAVKYSPEGGVICLTAKKISEAEIEISIADQGIGMSPGQVEKMFDKFYRVDTSDAAISGTGPGMSIVKNYVEAHGGKVWVESELGKGTVVKFVLQI